MVGHRTQPFSVFPGGKHGSREPVQWWPHLPVFPSTLTNTHTHTDTHTLCGYFCATKELRFFEEKNSPLSTCSGPYQGAFTQARTHSHRKEATNTFHGCCLKFRFRCVAALGRAPHRDCANPFGACFPFLSLERASPYG